MTKPIIQLGIVLMLSASGSGLLTGCALTGPDSHAWTGSAYFPDDRTVPRIVVHGNLLTQLPRADSTSALELFLYGPPDMVQSAMRNPQGVAINGSELLICDQGRFDVIATNLATGRSRFFCDPSNPPRCPVDVAVDAQGLVYVADTTLRSVLIYASDGRYRGELVTSADPDREFRPAAVTVHGDVVFIGNIGEHRIDRWSIAKQQWLAPWIPPSSAPPLYAPSGLCVGLGGVLFIADAVQGSVLRVSPDGTWLPPIGTPGRADGQLVRPKQVACTESGLLLVTDAGRQSMLVYDSTGRYLTEVHEGPADWPGWVLPCGIAVLPTDVSAAAWGSSGGEQVVVTDSLGRVSLTSLTAVTAADLPAQIPERSK